MNDEIPQAMSVMEIHAKNPLDAASQLLGKMELSTRDMLILSTSILAAIASTANREAPEASPFMHVDMSGSPTQIAIAVLSTVQTLPCDCPACTEIKDGLNKPGIYTEDTKH